MAIRDFFSKRMKRAREGEPDVYTYDQLPQPLRVQIIHIWRAVLGVAATRPRSGTDAPSHVYSG